MEEVIKRIIYIENKAQNVINDAEKEKISKQNELKDRLDALEKKLMADADKKIKRLREIELSEANAIALDSNESCTGRLKMIEQNSMDKKEIWAKNLYESVIRGD